jgi:hypothetical protein
MRSRIESHPGSAADLRPDALMLARSVAAVLELHGPSPLRYSDGFVCRKCNEPHPCATRAAIKETLLALRWLARQPRRGADADAPAGGWQSDSNGPRVPRWVDPGVPTPPEGA